MIRDIGSLVGGAMLNRSTITSVGVATLAAPIGIKLRQRRQSRHERSRNAAAGAGAAALAAPMGIGAAAIGSRLRRRRRHSRRFSPGVIGAVGAAALAMGMGAKLLKRRHATDDRDVRRDAGVEGADDLQRSSYYK